MALDCQKATPKQLHPTGIFSLSTVLKIIRTAYVHCKSLSMDHGLIAHIAPTVCRNHSQCRLGSKARTHQGTCKKCWVCNSGWWQVLTSLAEMNIVAFWVWPCVPEKNCNSQRNDINFGGILNQIVWFFRFWFYILQSFHVRTSWSRFVIWKLGKSETLRISGDFARKGNDGNEPWTCSGCQHVVKLLAKNNTLATVNKIQKKINLALEFNEHKYPSLPSNVSKCEDVHFQRGERHPWSSWHTALALLLGYTKSCKFGILADQQWGFNSKIMESPTELNWWVRFSANYITGWRMYIYICIYISINNEGLRGKRDCRIHHVPSTTRHRLLHVFYKNCRSSDWVYCLHLRRKQLR